MSGSAEIEDFRLEGRKKTGEGPRGNVKLFSKNSTLCDRIPQRHGQTHRRTDRQLAVAIGEIAYRRCRLVGLMIC